MNSNTALEGNNDTITLPYWVQLSGKTAVIIYTCISKICLKSNINIEDFLKELRENKESRQNLYENYNIEPKELYSLINSYYIPESIHKKVTEKIQSDVNVLLELEKVEEYAKEQNLNKKQLEGLNLLLKLSGKSIESLSKSLAKSFYSDLKTMRFVLSTISSKNNHTDIARYIKQYHSRLYSSLINKEI